MNSYEKPWPFGLNRKNIAVYLFGALLIVAALTGIDSQVTRLVASLPESVRAPFFIITRAGKSDWIFIPALIVSLLGLLLLRFEIASTLKAGIVKLTWWSFFIIAAVGVPGILALIFKRIIGRARPLHLEEFGLYHFQPNLGKWDFQSFPSGDTTTIFALAVALMFLFPKARTLLFIGAALVGLSRIMVGMHFPSDVFGGFLTGVLGAYLVRNYFASRGWLFEANGAGGYRLQ